MNIDELQKIEDNIDHLRSKVGEIKTAMLTTFTANGGFHSRPMGTAEVDELGNIWFFTNEFSAKAGEISMDNNVSLTYADRHANTYLSITGKAYLVDDRPKMEQLWNIYVQAFFPDGIDDPKLTLLKVDTEQMEYWESSTSTVVQLFKIAKAALTGDKYSGDHGIEALK